MVKQANPSKQGKRDDSVIPPSIGPVPLPTPIVPPETMLPNDSISPELLSLAMAFVPTQTWETPYNYDVALKRGTVFPSLDKPFIGEEAFGE